MILSNCFVLLLVLSCTIAFAQTNPPASLYVISFTDTSLTLQWDPPGSSSSGPYDYHLFMDDGAYGPFTSAYVGSANGYEVKHLRPLTLYNFQLWGESNGYVSSSLNATFSTSGQVVSVAGSYTEVGFVDGMGDDALFFGIEGIVMDAKGDIYVADYGNYVIRRINQDGNVTTVAGLPTILGSADGIGTNAMFSDIIGMVYDPIEDALFIADQTNGKVRKMLISNYSVSTLPVFFSKPYGPTGIALDVNARILYVSDNGNNVIKSVQLSGPITSSTIAGNSSGYADAIGTHAKFSSPSALTLDLPYLYISDINNNCIRRMNVDTFEVETFVGSSNAVDTVETMGQGQGSSVYMYSFSFTLSGVDSNHSIYTGDESLALRRITPNGYVSPVAGVTHSSPPASIGFIPGIGTEAQFVSFTVYVDVSEESQPIYFSDSFGLRKLVGTPPPAPEMIHYEVYNESIFIQWSPSYITPDPKLYYSIDVEIDGVYRYTSQLNDTSITFEYLQPNESLTVIMKATNVYGTSEKSNYTFTTGHGTCNDSFCVCDDGWSGSSCNTFTCEDLDDCSYGNGNCVGPNLCNCSSGWQGKSCNTYICDDINCGNNGFCVGPNTCNCSSGFSGDTCDSVSCSSMNNCSNHGACVGPNLCSCNMGFHGSACSIYCGDGICGSIGDYTENCVSCPVDCHNQTCGACGDGSCDNGENITTCYQDCAGTGSVESECLNDCSNRGSCSNGLCTCRGSYGGADCSQVKQGFGYNFTSTTPQVNLTVDASNSGFIIIIKEIREVDNNGENVTSVFLQDVKFNLTKTQDDIVAQTIYTATILENCQLNITFLYAEESFLLPYANQNISMSSNSLKFLANIQSWPFQSIRNSLQIIVSASGSNGTMTNHDGSNDGNCGGNQATAGYNSDGKLAWYEVFSGQYALYMPLVNLAVLDERVQYITFEMDESKDLAINVPYFWNDALVDPSYSVLLDSSQYNSCNLIIKSNQTLLITGVAVGCAVAFLILGVVVVIITHKRKLKRRSTMMQHLSSKIAASNSAK